MEKMIYTVDAKGRALGRVASEVASLLVGKKNPKSVKNVAETAPVRVVNAGGIKIAEKKLSQKTYASFSGYPGGLTIRTLGHVVSRRGISETLRSVVMGMLPKNKLRARMIKNLTISE